MKPCVECRIFTVAMWGGLILQPVLIAVSSMQLFDILYKVLGIFSALKSFVLQVLAFIKAILQDPSSPAVNPYHIIIEA